METAAREVHGYMDRIGAGLSFACALHCMLLPAVITALPLIGLGFLKEPAFETAMIIAAVTLAMMSLCWGTRVHGSRQTFLFLAGALLFFASGHLFERAHWFFMGLGGLCLAGGHVINRRLCANCHSCSH